MQILHAPDELNASKDAVLTIGNFDGVHRGHQTLIKRTLAISREKNMTSIVVTFWPHPRCVVAPQKTHHPLSTRTRRAELLAALGIDILLELPFTQDLANLSPESFVQRYLLPLRLRYLVTGYDFSLGKGRSGHTAELITIGERFGFCVEQMPPLEDNGLIISSTHLRALITQGDVKQAAFLLGRFYDLEGEVIHGAGRGKGLGFPTANMKPPKTLLPAEGVYAAKAHLSQDYPCLVNIGCNPTFGANALSIESYLLDTEADLYGARLSLSFMERLRDEVAFPSQEALVQQITKDIANAKTIFQEQNESR
ncbi:MAG: bifunctional riboflavin kinase/FAD synthetase [Desulfovibrio sp.]|nr:bifunctional riboflavin kinase/FAD synthetase [Desulfovibrio sp.]